MPIKINSAGGGSITIDVPNMSTANTLVLPSSTPAGSTLITNNYTGTIQASNYGTIVGKTALFETTTANSCVYIQALPANNGNRIDSYNYPITGARPLVINSANTRFWINDTETVTFNSSGIVDLWGGSGGAQLRMRNGGDFAIYSASDSYGTTLWCDPPQSGMASTGYLWVEYLNSHIQKCGYDRGWDNYPSITVRNDTTNGPQGEFRIHGGNGISGGDFSAALRCDGGFITGSDRRRKTNIEPITNALNTVSQLNGVRFNTVAKDGRVETELSVDGKKYGLIAQDTIDVIPECVKFYPEADTESETGWASAYSIDYPTITPLLIEAIKDLKAQIEVLKNEIDTLKGKN
jgi:hypothetical protein